MLQNSKNNADTASNQPPPVDPQGPTDAKASPRPFIQISGFGGLTRYILFFGLFIIYEKVAPPEYKASTIIGQFEGNTEGEALQTQVEGLKVKLAAEKTAEEKMQNDVNDYKQKLEIEQANTVNAYKQKLDIDLQNTVNQYKQQLDFQLQSEIERIKANYDYCNKVKIIGLTAIVTPLQEQMKQALSYDIMGSGAAMGELMHQFLGDTKGVEAGALAKIKQATDELLATPCTIEVTFTSSFHQGPSAQLPASNFAVAPSSPPAGEAPSAQAPTSSFQSGANDRTNWENWFASLPVGDVRSGAFYWTAMRNDKNHPPSCENNRHESYGDFTNGCREARKNLTPFEQKRASDAEYRSGWNSITLPARSAPATCAVVGIKPDDPDGGLTIRASSARGANALGVIPYNGRGIRNMGCACDGEPKAAKCRVSYNGVSGWVAPQFLLPD